MELDIKTLNKKYDLDSLLYLCMLCNFYYKEVLSYLPSDSLDSYRSIVINACRFGRGLRKFFGRK